MYIQYYLGTIISSYNTFYRYVFLFIKEFNVNIDIDNVIRALLLRKRGGKSSLPILRDTISTILGSRQGQTGPDRTVLR